MPSISRRVPHVFTSAVLRSHVLLCMIFAGIVSVPPRSLGGELRHDTTGYGSYEAWNFPIIQTELPMADATPGATIHAMADDPEMPTLTSLGNGSAEQDSAQAQPPRPRLVPESLSPVEHILWGERGILRTTGIAPFTPSARKKELEVRRGMLTVHQIGGFVTLGLLVPTMIYGQRNLQNWNDAVLANKPFDRQLNRTHKMWADLTFISYVATGALAILSPPPLIRRNEGSTITTHKLLAWLHFAGMMAMPILGSLAAHAKTLDQANTLRTVHQIVGYTTAAALATAMIVITF